MEAYTGFAEVYDTFMDNVPYEKWAEYVVGLLKKYGIAKKIERLRADILGHYAKDVKVVIAADETLHGLYKYGADSSF